MTQLTQRNMRARLPFMPYGINSLSNFRKNSCYSVAFLWYCSRNSEQDPQQAKHARLFVGGARDPSSWCECPPLPERRYSPPVRISAHPRTRSPFSKCSFMWKCTLRRLSTVSEWRTRSSQQVVTNMKAGISIRRSLLSMTGPYGGESERLFATV